MFKYSPDPVMDARLTLGTRIRQAREARGMDLKALSRATYFQESYLNKIEKGKIALNFDSICYLLRFFNLEIDFHESGI